MILDDILEGIERWGSVVRVTVTHCLGSTPREAGADMIVGSEDFCGSIGGGKLEFMALEKARTMLENETGQDGQWPRQTDNFVLGEQLRQCCGGVVWLLFEYYGPGHRQVLSQLRETLTGQAMLVHDVNTTGPLRVENTPCATMMHKDDEGRATLYVEPAHRASQPLVIYGAGHVGRALVRVLEGTPFAITWVDINKDRFPADVSADVCMVISANPADHAKGVGAGAFHVVMTHSHTLDLDICRVVLEAGRASYLGLIASKTKKSKFLNRLTKDGVPESALNVFHCPVGLGNWSGKQPSVIAISIAAELVDVLEVGLANQGIANRKHLRAVGGIT
ncbi:MAG: xanthine dehydrogenase accessory protein XdhC [Rhodospirillales bacterium]|nr:xanthine dehydrogenase accessory protein XdhC [Rhodospirillales bacterium]